MSGLAASWPTTTTPGIYRWHAAFHAAEVRARRRARRLAASGTSTAGTHQTRHEFLAAVGEALAFPDHYGQNLDALNDCLRDLAAAATVLLWDGWCTLARADEAAFSLALSVLGSPGNADAGAPFDRAAARARAPDVPAFRPPRLSARALRPDRGCGRPRGGQPRPAATLAGVVVDRRPGRARRARRRRAGR